MLHMALERIIKKILALIADNTGGTSINYFAYDNKICRLPRIIAKHVLVHMNNLIHCEIPSVHLLCDVERILSKASNPVVSGTRQCKFHLVRSVDYFFQIPSDRELCVDVQFDREYYVGVVQAVPVNVYDYYEPGEPR